MHADKTGLYIHIPFCAKKCDYCDFLSFVDHTPQDREEYAALLCKQVQLKRPRKISSIYIGGGTPSMMEKGGIASILSAVASHFTLDDGIEISIEVNPGTVDEEKLREYRAAGVNRLSMGAQSLDDELLRSLGRIHSSGEFLSSYELSAKHFDNINVDIMYGLPGQTLEHYRATLEQLCGFGPAHISAYSLIVEPGTLMHRRELPDDDLAADMHEMTRDFLTGCGFERYEISNYCKPGRECRHNLSYWALDEYEALGLGAVSMLREDVMVRNRGYTDLGKFAQALQQGTDPVEYVERIEKAAEMFEVVMMGLRMVKGIKLIEFERRFDISLPEAFPGAIPALWNQGLLTLRDGYARLTQQGLDLQNTALMHFMP